MRKCIDSDWLVSYGTKYSRKVYSLRQSSIPRLKRLRTSVSEVDSSSLEEYQSKDLFLLQICKHCNFFGSRLVPWSRPDFHLLPRARFFLASRHQPASRSVSKLKFDHDLSLVNALYFWNGHARTFCWAILANVRISHQRLTTLYQKFCSLTYSKQIVIVVGRIL